MRAFSYYYSVFQFKGTSEVSDLRDCYGTCEYMNKNIRVLHEQSVKDFQ